MSRDFAGSVAHWGRGGEGIGWLRWEGWMGLIGWVDKKGRRKQRPYDDLFGQFEHHRFQGVSIKV